MPMGVGSVKKKCTFGECSYAVFDAGDLCPRCSTTNAAVNSIVKARFDELHATIKKENDFFAQSQESTKRPPEPTPVSSAQPLPGQKKQVANAKQTKPSTSTPAATTTNIFAPKDVVPKEAVGAPKDTPVPAMLPKVRSTSANSAPKIVRTVDDPTKATSDLAIAKKRAQTPGRPRSISSSAEMKTGQ